MSTSEVQANCYSVFGRTHSLVHSPATCPLDPLATGNHAACILRKCSRASHLVGRFMQRRHSLRRRLRRKRHFAITHCRKWNKFKLGSDSQNNWVRNQPVLVDAGCDRQDLILSRSCNQLGGQWLAELVSGWRCGFLGPHRSYSSGLQRRCR